MAGQKVVFTLAEAAKQPPDVLGGKGHGLAVMASLGVPVPQALVVSTKVSRSYRQYGKLPARLPSQIRLGIQRLEKLTGKKFGNPSNPLLLSVRSGAVVSMPGMMDTVLNLGMTAEIVEGLSAKYGSAFAWDSYKRFLHMFGTVVFGVPAERLKIEGMPMVYTCTRMKEIISEWSGQPFPETPSMQLALAMIAVIQSWNSKRALLYRKENNIPDWWGTAINIQEMAFGNLNDESATGVVFSRDVATGAKVLYGEFLPRAQGEDIVAGLRTPLPIVKMIDWDEPLYRGLEKTVKVLEDHYKDVVDVEFTIENGKLFILQVRSAKRTAEAAVTIATNFVWEKVWTKEEAVKSHRYRARSLAKPVFDPEQVSQLDVLVQGLPASPGCITGPIVFSSEEAVEWSNDPEIEGGSNVILVRHDTSPDDLEGMLAAKAIITSTGGLTSHAAVVARGIGKPCIVGIEKIGFSSENKPFDDDMVKFGDTPLHRGDYISIDGATGKVFKGIIDFTEKVDTKKEVAIFMKWVKELEPPKPAPRVGFEWFGRRQSENVVLNDFYISDAMAQKAEGTDLEAEAITYRDDVHLISAESLACYLAVACAGELRHSFSHCRTSNSSISCGCMTCVLKNPVNFYPGQKEALFAREKLVDVYGLKSSGSGRESTQIAVINKLKMGDEQYVSEFFFLADMVFRKFRWSSGYGGKNWANIALAPQRFLVGDYSHSVFCDHVFDLQHNNGSVFGKNSMFKGTREYVKRQLDEKKRAKTVADLLKRLKPWGQISPKTMELFDKGKKIGIW